MLSGVSIVVFKVCIKKVCMKIIFCHRLIHRLLSTEIFRLYTTLLNILPDKDCHFRSHEWKPVIVYKIQEAMGLYYKIVIFMQFFVKHYFLSRKA